MKVKLIRKRIFALGFLLFFTASTLFSPFYVDAKSKSSAADYKEGDSISLGTLDGINLHWTILSIDKNSREALIVSRIPIYTKSVREYKNDIAKNYNGKRVGYVQWADNFWRYWLNSTFIDSAFSQTERQMIKLTNITATSHQNSLLNFYHDNKLDAFFVENEEKNSLNLAIYNNQKNSQDYVFFLSTDDYTNYKDKILTQQKSIWPLRTNAYDDPAQSLYVNDTKGLIERHYTYDAIMDGIRPAMTIKLADAPVEPDSNTKKTSSATSSTAPTNDTNQNDSSSDTTKDEKNTTDNNAEDKKSEDKKSDENKSDEKTKTTTKTQSATTAKSQSATSKKTTNTKSKNKATQRFRRSYSNNAKDISSVSKSGNTISLPNDSNYSMKKNSSASIALDLNYLNSTGKDFTVTYKSSDAAIFTVDSAGNISSGSKNGSATLTVRMKKSNGKTYNMTCRIDVS